MLDCCGVASPDRYLSLTLGRRFGGLFAGNNYRLIPPETYADVYGRVRSYLAAYDMSSIPANTIRQVWIYNAFTVDFIVEAIVDSIPLPSFFLERRTFNNFIQTFIPDAGSQFVRIGINRNAIGTGHAVNYSPETTSPVVGCQNYIGPVELSGPILIPPTANNVLVSQPWSLVNGSDAGCPGP